MKILNNTCILLTNTLTTTSYSLAYISPRVVQNSVFQFIVGSLSVASLSQSYVQHKIYYFAAEICFLTNGYFTPTNIY